MRAAGGSSPSPKARAVSLAIVVLAVLVGAWVLHREEARPSSEEATIDAEVVHVAASVGGRIVEIAVSENAAVEAGALLFRIDPEPYRLALDQTRADLAVAEAALETRRRVVATQRSAAAIASDQVKRAATNLDLAARTAERLRPLAAKGYVPQLQLDQATTAERDAATSLAQAREQETAAERAIDTDAAAVAAVAARTAAVAIAARALADTEVRAPHAGRVVGLTVATGEIVAPGQSLFTLVGSEEWFAVANFREYELAEIAEGDCATVWALTDRRRPIAGRVQGIGAGVADTERINLPRSVPYVAKSMNWVRIAQRFPVRIALRDPPPGLMRLGASAVVEVKHGAACR